MARVGALVLLILLLAAGEALAQGTPRGYNVYVVDGPFPTDQGAAGLLVPGAGPETSREQALQSLLSGEARNSLRGPQPEGRQAINLATLSGAPTAPYILVSLPKGGTQPNGGVWIGRAPRHRLRDSERDGGQGRSDARSPIIDQPQG